MWLLMLAALAGSPSRDFKKVEKATAELLSHGRGSMPADLRRAVPTGVEFLEEQHPGYAPERLKLLKLEVGELELYEAVAAGTARPEQAAALVDLVPPTGSVDATRVRQAVVRVENTCVTAATDAMSEKAYSESHEWLEVALSMARAAEVRGRPGQLYGSLGRAALTALKAGREDRARELLIELVQLEDAMATDVRTLAKLQEPADRITTLQAGVKRFPDEEVLIADLAGALLLADKPSEALALAKSRTDGPLGTGFLWITALAHEELNAYPEARAAYQLLAERTPDDGDVWFRHGASYVNEATTMKPGEARSAALGKARELMSEALKRMPGDRDVIDTLVQLNTELGDLDEAERLKRSVE